jgi:hypothetical protein
MEFVRLDLGKLTILKMENYSNMEFKNEFRNSVSGTPTEIFAVSYGQRSN